MDSGMTRTSSRAASGMGTGIPTWSSFFASQFQPVPLVVILRGLSPKDAVSTARQAWDCGVRLVEVTMESERGLPALEAVVRAAPHGLPVGAGTVTTPARLARAVAAGARFGVAPGFDTDTVLAAEQADVPFLPGIATPTEAGQALRLGISTVKAFPASALGPEWVRALAGPFPSLQVVATGGITATTAPAYLQAGAIAVGVGSSLLADGDLRSFVEEIRSA